MAKTIFFTGASSGIGKATAKFFAEKGWNVIATMRAPEMETELTNLKNITLLPLDVTSVEQIGSTVEKAISLASIDVVVNNAGYGIVGALEGTADGEIERLINTNLIGVIRVTKAFLPHFREKKSGMFITVSSEGGMIAYPFFSLYHATKWAIEGWTESMAFELNPLGIQIKTVLPGPTKTDFGGRSLVVSKHVDYEQQFGKFFDTLLNKESINTFPEVETVSEVIYEAATDGKNQLRYFAGKIANDNYAKRLELGAENFHQTMEKEIFG
jgi:short-subunit dehydrogenase